jgi:hypothetical protein
MEKKKMKDDNREFKQLTKIIENTPIRRFNECVWSHGMSEAQRQGKPLDAYIDKGCYVCDSVPEESGGEVWNQLYK